MGKSQTKTFLAKESGGSGVNTVFIHVGATGPGRSQGARARGGTERRRREGGAGRAGGAAEDGGQPNGTAPLQQHFDLDWDSRVRRRLSGADDYGDPGWGPVLPPLAAGPSPTPRGAESRSRRARGRAGPSEAPDPAAAVHALSVDLPSTHARYYPGTRHRPSPLHVGGFRAPQPATCTSLHSSRPNKRKPLHH